MTGTMARLVAAAALLTGVAATEAPAQSLGTFRWQLQPYCNVLTVSITQVGGIYRAEGTDDQCGAATQGSVIGTAFPNPDGSIGLGFNIVATPGGRDVSVDAKVTLPGASGTWRDNAGATGTFALTPGAGTGGSPRPLTTGAVGAADINANEVQRRVAATCPADGAIRQVNADGTVVCTSAGTGDITGVTAGTGLTGGGPAGAVSLAVSFGADGTATSAARADHYHGAGSFMAVNTGVGYNVFGGGSGGAYNTAVGGNVAAGISTGSRNAGLGTNALRSLSAGSRNTAVGDSALYRISSSDGNVAVGADSLGHLQGGTANIAIGTDAGDTLVLGSDNIYIGSPGAAGDLGQIRIGTQGTHTGAIIQGIHGQGASGGIPVLINAGGRLGTSTSSRRFKQDITTVTDAARVIQALRPVRFLYKPEFDDGSRTPQYGLIAEEVADVEPELAVLARDGTPETVRYHFLAPLLVAEAQRLEQARQAQTQENADLRAALQAQAVELAQLRDVVAALQSRLPVEASKQRR